MPAGGGRNAGNRGCVPGVKDPATVPLPTEGPWATGSAAAEGVIRKDWALYEVDVLNWVRLNEALRNLSGHSELRFAQEVIWVGERSSRNSKWENKSCCYAWRLGCSFFISLVFCLPLITAMVMEKTTVFIDRLRTCWLGSDFLSPVIFFHFVFVRIVERIRPCSACNMHMHLSS